jgi:hypothetical protein
MFRVVGSTVGKLELAVSVLFWGCMGWLPTHWCNVGWWFIRLLFARQLHIRFSGSIDTNRTTTPVYCLPPLE